MSRQVQLPSLLWKATSFHKFPKFPFFQAVTMVSEPSGMPCAPLLFLKSFFGYVAIETNHIESIFLLTEGATHSEPING